MMRVVTLITFCVAVTVSNAADNEEVPGSYILTNTVRDVTNWAGANVTIPDINFTICFWAKIDSWYETRRSTILSMAASAKDNWLIFELEKSHMVFVIKSKYSSVSLFETELNKWYFYCFSAEETLTHYQYTLNVGENTCNLVWVQKFSKNIQKQPKSKRDYAVGLVLFSDQDELFGGFDPEQVAVASISCLNIWSSVYQEDQLVDFAECKQEGDVFTMKPGALAIHGTITSEMKPVADEPKSPGKLWK
ncbi:hypothetical protein EB796_022399 [Bugula neritina]|uniref:Pentraxin (PTX) domain-containing protein n=1 Tax=Bugula neritina TaxID=10212 RepID=A0A7J7IZK0_BUGNE|nr:hypothetical protein EB796_022399 [Bugula neritina]